MAPGIEPGNEPGLDVRIEVLDLVVRLPQERREAQRDVRTFEMVFYREIGIVRDCRRDLMTRRREAERVELNELIREILLQSIVLLVRGGGLLVIFAPTCSQNSIRTQRVRCGNARLQNIVVERLTRNILHRSRLVLRTGSRARRSRHQRIAGRCIGQSSLIDQREVLGVETRVVVERVKPKRTSRGSGRVVADELIAVEAQTEVQQ